MKENINISEIMQAVKEETEKAKKLQRAVNVYTFDQLSEAAQKRALESLMKDKAYKSQAHDEFERLTEDEVACAIAKHERFLALDAENLVYSKGKFGFSDIAFYEYCIKEALLINNFPKAIVDNFDYKIFNGVIDECGFSTIVVGETPYTNAANFIGVLMINELNTVLKDIKEAHDKANKFYFEDPDGYVRDYMKIFSCDFLADGTYIDVCWDDYTQETQQAMIKISAERDNVQ